jgi:hypothetical protein
MHKLEDTVMLVVMQSGLYNIFGNRYNRSQRLLQAKLVNKDCPKHTFSESRIKNKLTKGASELQINELLYYLFLLFSINYKNSTNNKYQFISYSSIRNIHFLIYIMS